MNKEQIPFDEVQGLLDSGVEPEDIFQWFYRFNNGFARVQLNGKYNFIDKNGNLYDGKPSIQENRSPIKITETDIRMMVNEAINRLRSR